jgi:NAD(P)H-hydrate epimerase
MKLVTAAQMRELEHRTIREGGLTGEELMDRAGRGVADLVRHMSDITGTLNPCAMLFAGRGNNGGDAFAAARHLKDMGFDVWVWLAGMESEVEGDALKHLSALKSQDVAVEEMPTRESWESRLQNPAGADFLIDGLLGTGSSGAARGAVAAAIRYINRVANDAFVVSIDIPSGLDADTGIAEGDAVYADVTVTLGAPKIGLIAPGALEFAGGVEVTDIGIPAEWIRELPSCGELELIYSMELKRLFPRRVRSSHKGTYGHVLLIGGATGTAGAIALAARAAARSGVGLTTALVPECIRSTVATASLETMVYGGPFTEAGSLSASAWDAWAERLEDFDAILVGPGLSNHTESRTLVRRILSDCRVPLVLDADGLNAMAGHAELIDRARCPVLLTPHPGELARLIGRDPSDIQSDRLAAARETVNRTGAILALKGAGTLVTARERSAFINLTGNPGMATGGCGDVLAGLMTGLVGQGIEPFEACKAAVFLHGRAGDMAAWRVSQIGMTASDLVNDIPFVFRELTWR